MKFTRVSIVSGIERTRDLPVTEEQMKKFNEGALIQECFPQLSNEDREFLITGMTQE